MKYSTFFLLLFSAAIYASARADDGRYYFDINSGFKTGDFGTSTRSNLFYFSPGFGYIAPQYDVSMSGSFLVLRNSDSGMSGTEAGAGDLVIRGGSLLSGDNPGKISLYGSLAVKLPLADEGKGLGTGEIDYGAFAEMSKRVNKNRFSVRAGYIKTGDGEFDYNDIYLYSIGASRIFGKTDIEVSLDGRRAIITGEKNPLELNFSLFHILNKDYSIKYSNFVGLNKGGPDFGLNLGFTRWF
ncbi:MAG: hypothetical protein AB1498_04410 [bacterium]